LGIGRFQTRNFRRQLSVRRFQSRYPFKDSVQAFANLDYFTIFIPHEQFLATLNVSPKLKIRLRSHQMRVNLQLSTSFSTGSNVKNTIRVFSSTLPTLDPT